MINTPLGGGDDDDDTVDTSEKDNKA